MGRKAPNDELEIRHDEKEHRFVARIEGVEKESVLDPFVRAYVERHPEIAGVIAAQRA